MKKTERGQARSRQFVKSVVLLAGALGILLAALILAEFRRPLNSDSAWLLYLARRVLEGDRLYVELVEINPPLVVWLQLPVVFLARWLGVDPTVVFRVAVFMLIGVCLFLSAQLLRTVTPRTSERRWILLAIVLVLLGWTRAHFGQREHIALAAILPYLLASAAAAQGHVLGPPLGVTVAAIAAIGFAMKPHFVLVWMAALAYVTWRRRDTTWTMGLENRVVLGILSLYAVMVLVAAPEYLNLVGRLASTYDAFARKSVATLMLHSVETLCGIGALLAYGLLRACLRSRETGDVFALATGAFLLVALAQRKGFSYHYYPVSACTLLLAAVALGGRDACRARITERVGVLMLGVILLLGAGSGTAWSLVQLWREEPVYQRQQEMADYIREHASDGSVLRLSYEDSFPLIDQASGRWTMRFPNLWFVQALYADQLGSKEQIRYRPPSQMTDPERWCFEAVIDDFLRERPSLLTVIRPNLPGVTGLPTRLDYLTYFSQDRRFAAALEAYEFIGVVAGYSVFQRRL